MPIWDGNWEQLSPLRGSHGINEPTKNCALIFTREKFRKFRFYTRKKGKNQDGDAWETKGTKGKSASACQNANDLLTHMDVNAV